MIVGMRSGTPIARVAVLFSKTKSLTLHFAKWRAKDRSEIFRDNIDALRTDDEFAVGTANSPPVAKTRELCDSELMQFFPRTLDDENGRDYETERAETEFRSSWRL